MIAGLFYALVVFALFYGRLPRAVLLALAAGAFLLCRLLRRKRGHTHSAFLAIDSRARQSGLSHCHTGTKVCFCVLCSFVCVAADSPLLSLFVAASMLLLTVGAGKISLGYYLELLFTPLSFILLGTAAVFTEVSHAPMGVACIPVGSFYLCVTREGQQAALLLICRAWGAVSCLYFLCLSTPMHRIISFLRRVRIPALAVELMYLIYRYLFVLLEAQHQMRAAADSRLGYRDCGTGLRTMCLSSMHLLFLSFRRSSDCFAAMEARCYDGQIAFWERAETIRWREICPALGYGLLLCALWFATRRWGL